MKMLKALSAFGAEDIPAQTEISRFIFERLKDIENPSTAGPVTPAARAALAIRVVAHAVVELKKQVIKLRK